MTYVIFVDRLSEVYDQFECEWGVRVCVLGGGGGRGG